MAGKFSVDLFPKAPKLRPCMVGDRKGLFHRWEDYAAVIDASPMIGGHPGGQLRETYAIVELEDGQIKEFKPNKVRFCDTQEYIKLVEAAYETD